MARQASVSRRQRARLRRSRQGYCSRNRSRRLPPTPCQERINDELRRFPELQQGGRRRGDADRRAPARRGQPAGLVRSLGTRAGRPVAGEARGGAAPAQHQRRLHRPQGAGQLAGAGGAGGAEPQCRTQDARGTRGVARRRRPRRAHPAVPQEPRLLPPALARRPAELRAPRRRHHRRPSTLRARRAGGHVRRRRRPSRSTRTARRSPICRDTSRTMPSRSSSAAD
jgi:hypothetical protein